MTFLEKLKTIERLDQLIRMKATGSPNHLAEKVGISRRCLFNIIDLMKTMSAPIKFCTNRQTYYYEYDCELAIGFTDKSKIVGGQNVKISKNLHSANFLHYDHLNLN